MAVARATRLIAARLYVPSPKVVLKATYQKVINKDPAGANADSVLGGVGFFF